MPFSFVVELGSETVPGSGGWGSKKSGICQLPGDDFLETQERKYRNASEELLPDKKRDLLELRKNNFSRRKFLLN